MKTGQDIEIDLFIGDFADELERGMFKVALRFLLRQAAAGGAKVAPSSLTK